MFKPHIRVGRCFDLGGDILAIATGLTIYCNAHNKDISY